MLDYTKAAIKQVTEDFKKVDLIRNIVTQILYLAYLIYAIFARMGIFAVNLTLFALSAAYFAFFIYMTVQEVKKTIKKTIQLIFTRCKQIIKLFTLGVMLYGLWQTTKHVTPLSVIFSALMIVGWILQILFEVVFKFFINRGKLILAGMEADYENITKPVKTVGNFFKKLTGKEVEEKEPSKARLILDEKVRQAREEKENEKLEQKYLKKSEKQRKKEERAAQKAAKKAAKREPAPTETVEEA